MVLVWCGGSLPNLGQSWLLAVSIWTWQKLGRRFGRAWHSALASVGGRTCDQSSPRPSQSSMVLFWLGLYLFVMEFDSFLYFHGESHGKIWYGWPISLFEVAPTSLLDNPLGSDYFLHYHAVGVLVRLGVVLVWLFILLWGKQSTISESRRKQAVGSIRRKSSIRKRWRRVRITYIFHIK